MVTIDIKRSPCQVADGGSSTQEENTLEISDLVSMARHDSIPIDGCFDPSVAAYVILENIAAAG